MANEDFPISDFESIPGGAKLLAWFGYVPSFHDAEIISLHLNRSGPSTLKIHTWNPTNKLNQRGSFILDKDVIVTFTLEGITALQLEDFSIQNVIYGLEFRKVPQETSSFNMQWLTPPEQQPDLYEIILEPCYGLSGKIQARRVSIELTPGKPENL